MPWHNHTPALIWSAYCGCIVVHTCQLGGDGALDGLPYEHAWASNVFIHANLPVPVSLLLYMYLWKQRIVTFVEESLATIQETRREASQSLINSSSVFLVIVSSRTRSGNEESKFEKQREQQIEELVRWVCNLLLGFLPILLRWYYSYKYMMVDRFVYNNRMIGMSLFFLLSKLYHPLFP